MISEKILKYYNLSTLEDFKRIKNASENNETEIEVKFYEDFLNRTDYLAIKLAEGLITRDDKKAEFDARDFARAEINRLQK